MDDIPPEITIRAARPLDAESICAMQSLPGFRYGTLRLPYPAVDDIRRFLESPTESNPRLVAVSQTQGPGEQATGEQATGEQATGKQATAELANGQQVVGMVDLRRFTGRRAHAASIGIGVHDAWTGRGVGRALMAEIVALAERWLGIRRLELTVQADNARAIALYRRFDFAVEGTFRAHSLRDGVLIDTYAMARLTL